MEEEGGENEQVEADGVVFTNNIFNLVLLVTISQIKSAALSYF